LAKKESETPGPEPLPLAVNVWSARVFHSAFTFSMRNELSLARTERPPSFMVPFVRMSGARPLAWISQAAVPSHFAGVAAAIP